MRLSVIALFALAWLAAVVTDAHCAEVCPRGHGRWPDGQCVPCDAPGLRDWEPLGEGCTSTRPGWLLSETYRVQLRARFEAESERSAVAQRQADTLAGELAQCHRSRADLGDRVARAVETCREVVRIETDPPTPWGAIMSAGVVGVAVGALGAVILVVAL